MCFLFFVFFPSICPYDRWSSVASFLLQLISFSTCVSHFHSLPSLHIPPSLTCHNLSLLPAFHCLLSMVSASSPADFYLFHYAFPFSLSAIPLLMHLFSLIHVDPQFRVFFPSTFILHRWCQCCHVFYYRPLPILTSIPINVALTIT